MLDHGEVRVVVTSAVDSGYCRPVVVAGAATDSTASSGSRYIAGCRRIPCMWLVGIEHDV